MARNHERPILSIMGRAREGTESPTALYNDFIVSLKEAMPEAHMNHTIDRNSFSVDLTLYVQSEPQAEGEAEDVEGGE